MKWEICRHPPQSISAVNANIVAWFWIIWEEDSYRKKVQSIEFRNYWALASPTRSRYLLYAIWIISHCSFLFICSFRLSAYLFISFYLVWFGLNPHTFTMHFYSSDNLCWTYSNQHFWMHSCKLIWASFRLFLAILIYLYVCVCIYAIDMVVVTIRGCIKFALHTRNTKQD